VEAFLKCFVRDHEGHWHCIEHATLDLPSGRVQVNPGSVFVKGVQFMNIDLAEYLDAQDMSPSGNPAGERPFK
jgi:hypothetical protein